MFNTATATAYALGGGPLLLSSGGRLAVVKDGAGTWSFNGAAIGYTGGGTIRNGTPRTGASGNATTLFGTGAITFLNNSALRLGATVRSRSAATTPSTPPASPVSAGTPAC